MFLAPISWRSIAAWTGKYCPIYCAFYFVSECSPRFQTWSRTNIDWFLASFSLKIGEGDTKTPSSRGKQKHRTHDRWYSKKWSLLMQFWSWLYIFWAENIRLEQMYSIVAFWRDKELLCWFSPILIDGNWINKRSDIYFTCTVVCLRGLCPCWI
jgi:hypothetical protein